MSMFLRPKDSLRLSIYTTRRCIGFSIKRDFHLTHCKCLRKVSAGRRKVSNVVDYESSPSVAGEFPVSVAPKNVNDNFYGIESDAGVIQINSKPSLNNNATRQFLNNVEQEKFITTTFGTVRYDSQNKPKHHGQLEKEKVLINSIVENHKIRNLSQTLQNKIKNVDSHSVSFEMEKNSKKITDMSDRNEELTSSSYVDEVYFPEVYTEKEKKKISRLETAPTSFNNDKVNFIEESYFIDKTTNIASENSSTDKCSFPVHETSKTHSSFADELDFPEPYTKKEPNHISKLEASTANDVNANFIEESYFIDKATTEPIFKIADIASENSSDNHSFAVHETSTEFIVNNKSSSFPTTSGSESSTSIDNKSNFIENHYLSDKLADEPIKNVNVTSTNIDNTDKNNPILAQENSTECITDDKQSNIFADYYVNTISDGNLENIDKKSLDSDTKIVDIPEKKSNQENSTMLSAVEKIEVLENNLKFKNDPEVSTKNFQVPDKYATFNTTNFSHVQEAEANIKTLHKVNESAEEEINADDNGDQLSFQWNNPSLEELEGYNQFLPNATLLPKKKNNFLFQSKEFLKESELINSNNSRPKNLISAQKDLGETDSAEKSQNKENMVKSPQKAQDVNAKNPNTNEPETAYDFVKKLRSTKKKSDPELINGKFIQKTEQYDSRGFRILKNQVPDLKYYTRHEILDLLTKNILYSDDDLIVLNKPYNLVMHESKTVKDPCLSEYLDDLAAELDKKTYKPKLITVHRLDKETCGCLLLARNEISAQRLLSLFSERKMVKTYWIVTTKVPEPAEGIIDMPISEGSINGRARMVLHPNLPKDISYQNHSKSGKRAVTHYKVIAESGNATLVEAKPETGIKHQIRVHFGFGLSCPILGDHKYSHLDKLAPQKLQSDLLQRLHVRQSKVRHIPMHIYARSVFIPQYRDGKNLFVMAPMPIHMSKNLQKLKFKKR